MKEAEYLKYEEHLIELCPNCRKKTSQFKTSDKFNEAIKLCDFCDTAYKGVSKVINE